MLTREENDILTQVGRDTAMGQLLREYWHPVMRAETLVAGEAPVSFELLGERLVAYRSPDGSLGIVDQHCPHRRASMALARNELGGLRCIFHGWKFDAQGRALDVPSEPPERSAAFAEKARIGSYLVQEAAGVVWAYLGNAETPPPFPAFEFTGLPGSHVDIRIGIVNCNWVQGIEGVLDSAHLAFLHRGQDNRQIASDYRLHESGSPVFDVMPTSYGFREGAIRRLRNGDQYVKIREYAAPYYSFVPGIPENLKNRMLVAVVPFNDVQHAQWHFYYNVEEPLSEAGLQQRWLNAGPDKNNIYQDPGGAENAWHQDRQAMSEGHFSGLVGRYISVEDFIVQESMGPITDRTREFLGHSDTVIVYARRKLISAAREFVRSGEVWGRESSSAAYSAIRSCAVVLEAGEDWRAVDARVLSSNPARAS